MNVLLMSIFRDSVEYLPRYLNLCHALDTALYMQDHRLTFLWGEGDSGDGTRQLLQAAKWRFAAELLNVTHGGENYGSVVKPERFRQLAAVGRQMFAAIPASVDAVIWVESDLMWQPATLLGLVTQLGPDCAAAAPSIILEREHWAQNSWYDTHAFYTADGMHFDHQPPYHPANTGLKRLEMASVGSCVAMHAEYARRVVVDEQVIMGVCAQIRAMGGRIWYDPSLPAVIHC